jgi:ribosomal protein L31
MIMTQFKKEEFTWDGEYLMYTGNFDGARMMMDVCPDAHPSWAGKLKPAFVARFKYNKRDKASFQKFLIANFTCEEYFNHMEKYNMGPLEVLIGKGWMTPAQKRASESGEFNALMQANY